MTQDSLTQNPVAERYPTVRASARELELWRGDRCLFDQLSFHVDKPVLHVKGENGSGKTTLLKVLCGLTAVEHGNVMWQVDEQTYPVDQMHGLLSYCGHQEGLNPALTASENLLWGAGLYQPVKLDDVQQLAERFGLAHLLPVAAGGLSAGQRRRISLMRSVLANTAVWVWDEPYANLDTAGVAWVNQLINEHTEQGGCLVVSAHQEPDVGPQAVQVLELKA